MSWKAIQWAQQQHTGKAHYKSVLQVLAAASMDKPIVGGIGSTFQCHLSHRVIAERAEVSLDTAQDACTKFQERGIVFRRLRYDGRGRRTSNEFFLNVADEDPASFVDRLGVRVDEWEAERAKPLPAVKKGQLTKPLPAAKDASSLGRRQQPTKPPPAGGQSLEPGLEPGEGAPAQESLAGELPADWSLPEEWRRDTLAHFEATSQQLNSMALRFRNHYLNLAEPKHRKGRNWRARWGQWCLEDLIPRSMAQASIRSGELPIDAQQRVVKNYRDGQPWPPTLGPPPDAAGCKMRSEVLAEFGFSAPLSGRAAA